MAPFRDYFNTAVQSNTRQVVGRNSQGTQGERGSLLRARKLKDPSERYYDSMIPDITNLMKADDIHRMSTEQK